MSTRLAQQDVEFWHGDKVRQAGARSQQVMDRHFLPGLKAIGQILADAVLHNEKSA